MEPIHQCDWQILGLGQVIHINYEKNEAESSIPGIGSSSFGLFGIKKTVAYRQPFFLCHGRMRTEGSIRRSSREQWKREVYIAEAPGGQSPVTAT